MPMMAEPEALVYGEEEKGQTLYIRSRNKRNQGWAKEGRCGTQLGATAPKKRGLQGVMCSERQHSSANCHKDVATDEVGEAS